MDNTRTEEYHGVKKKFFDTIL